MHVMHGVAEALSIERVYRGVGRDRPALGSSTPDRNMDENRMSGETRQGNDMQKSTWLELGSDGTNSRHNVIDG